MYMCRKTILERMTCTQTLRNLCPAPCWAPALHHPVGPEWAWRRAALKNHHILSRYGPGTSPYSSICTRSMGAFQRSVLLHRRPAIWSIEASVPDIIVKWAYLQLWLWDYSCDALHSLLFPLGIKSVVVNLVCTLVCSTAAVTAQRVLRASWSVCVLRWRRVIRRPCYSSFSRLYMCLSAITIRWEWEEVTLFIFSEVLVFKVVMFLYWVIYSHLRV